MPKTEHPGFFVPWTKLNALMAEASEKQDKRHEENIERIAKLDEKFGHLQVVVDAHIEADAKGFESVNRAIIENTAETKRGVLVAEQTKEGIDGLLSIYKMGQGVWIFGKGLKTFLWVTFGICGGATGTYLLVMYWIGRGPLPPLH